MSDEFLKIGYVISYIIFLFMFVFYIIFTFEDFHHSLIHSFNNEANTNFRPYVYVDNFIMLVIPLIIDHRD